MEWLFISSLPLPCITGCTSLYLVQGRRQRQRISVRSGNWLYPQRAGPASSSPSLHPQHHVINALHWRHLAGRQLSISFSKVWYDFQSPGGFLRDRNRGSFWHFAYGVWLFAAKWGLTVGDKAATGIRVCLFRIEQRYCWSSGSGRSPASSLPAIRFPMYGGPVQLVLKSSAGGPGFIMAHLKLLLWVAGWRDWRPPSKSPRWEVTLDLFSIVPVKRSHSVCAQGGINAAKNPGGEGDSTWIHFDDTVRWRLSGQPAAVKAMKPQGRHRSARPHGCSLQPHTPRACWISPRNFGGTLQPHRVRKRHGQQLLYALDEQVRRYESEEQGRQVRSLGIPLGRHRRSACLLRHLRTRSAQHAGAPSGQSVVASLPNVAPSLASRRSVRLVPARRNRRCISKARSLTASSFRFTRPAFRRRQAAENGVGIGARRRVVAACGCPNNRATSAIPKSIPEGRRWYWKVVSADAATWTPP